MSIHEETTSYRLPLAKTAREKSQDENGCLGGRGGAEEEERRRMGVISQDLVLGMGALGCQEESLNRWKGR